MNRCHDDDDEDSQGWDLLDSVLQESQEEEVEADSAEACRTQSDSEDESTCNVWWVPLLKSHVSRSMAELKPGFNNRAGSSSKRKVVNVVSACCGCLAEAESLKAHPLVTFFRVMSQ